MNWSFFESCHGKCYCDPEGGVLKNAARRYELAVSDKAEQLKTSEQFYTWARLRSGLSTPKYTLREKKGRGILRRFFYWIPSKGIGAVDRSHLLALKAEGTSVLHEFIDIGVVGVVSTRRAACHRCDKCWDFDQRCNCKYSAYVGAIKELQITQENVPTAAVGRIQRATLNRDALARAAKAIVGSIVAVETHKDEQMHPWVIGKVVEPMHNAIHASTPYDPTKDALHLEPFKAKDPALKLRLYEALDVGSATYFESEEIVVVPARCVRVIDVQLEVARSSSRLQVSIISCARPLPTTKYAHAKAR